MRRHLRRLRLFLLTWVFTTLTSVSTLCAREPQRWALLIGINDYVNAEDLKYCVADQLAFRDQLIQSGFPKDHVFLMHDDAREKQYLPNKTNIERQFKLVLGMAEPDDIVLVAFSGHGAHLDKVSYLCPSEGLLDKPDSLVSLDNVYAELKQCAAAFKLVIVDACRNDPRPPGQKSLNPRTGARQFAESLKAPEGVVLLNSCTAGEVSYEEQEFGHGVFMNFVLKGLKGTADKDHNGVVTLAELSEFAGHETKLYVKNKKNDLQRPFLRGDLTIDALGFSLGNVVNLKQHLKNSISMDLVLIPAGEFTMGSSDQEIDASHRGFYNSLIEAYPELKEKLQQKSAVGNQKSFENGQPTHRTRISSPFYMGKHEVTLREFLTFYHDAKYKCECELDGKGGWGCSVNEEGVWGGFNQKPEYRPWSWGFAGQTQGHPVVNVSWNDAKAFCDWLSEKEGRQYRLPTEAEWEYACRAGTTTLHPSGDQTSPLAKIANVADQSHKRILRLSEHTPVANYGDGFGITSPVGSFAPNGFGLYDMIGNVAEWCEDDYVETAYAGRVGTTVDPIVKTGGEFRVFRGGSWKSPPGVGSAQRNFGFPAVLTEGIGFRVVLVTDSVKNP